MIKRETKSRKQKQQIVCMKILLRKKQQPHGLRIIKNVNDTTDNQDNIFESKILKIGKLKYDRKYNSS